MTPRNPWICITIVVLLGSPLLAVSAASVLHAGELPPAIVDLSKFTAGALASFLVMIPRGSMGGGGANEAQTPGK